MSVDSERMLKLEGEVKELKSYIDRLVGGFKSETGSAIDSLKKSVGHINVHNKSVASKSDSESKELKKETKAAINNFSSSFNEKITQIQKEFKESSEITNIKIKDACKISQELKNNLTNLGSKLSKSVSNLTDSVSKIEGNLKISIENSDTKINQINKIITLASAETKKAAAKNLDISNKSIKELGISIEKLMSDTNRKINYNKQSADDDLTELSKKINTPIVKQELAAVDPELDIKRIVNKEYINNLYRNK